MQVNDLICAERFVNGGAGRRQVFNGELKSYYLATD